MKRRAIFYVALSALALSVTSARAANIQVTSDAGVLSVYELKNDGPLSPGSSTTVLELDLPTPGLLTVVNGQFVPSTPPPYSATRFFSM